MRQIRRPGYLNGFSGMMPRAISGRRGIIDPLFTKSIIDPIFTKSIIDPSFTKRVPRRSNRLDPGGGPPDRGLSGPRNARSAQVMMRQPAPMPQGIIDPIFSKGIIDPIFAKGIIDPIFAKGIVDPTFTKGGKSIVDPTF